MILFGMMTRMKEFIGGQKTEQDIQDKDNRIYRITAWILEFQAPRRFVWVISHQTSQTG
jgi:hypothetical protein